jgi:hypothetical protein
MLLLVRGKKSRFNFLFVFICCLKVDPWPIMKTWASCCNSLTLGIILECIGPPTLVVRLQPIGMKWLWTKHKIWCRMFNSFLFFMMKSQLVNNSHGFQYMHMWLKVGKNFFYYCRYNKWLMGPLQIIWNAF